VSNPNPTIQLEQSQREQIKEIVCEILELEPDEVTETSLFKDDHGADSLGAIEILAALERTLHITIDQAELSRMVNLEGIYQVIGESASR
jgi:acyl carrier protein